LCLRSPIGPLAILAASRFGALARRAFFVGGDKQATAKLAQMKGQMVEIRLRAKK
jgi:hypothetical protein